MKKTKFIALALCVTFLSSSCLGSYTAFNNLKDWNHQVSQNKFVNNLLFWGLNIIPVYGLFFIGDTLIFNTIEFWSGSNPLAMTDGQMETQTIVKNGNTYEMTATKNKLVVEVIDGKDEGKKVDFNYLPEDKTWEATTQEGETFKLSSLKDGKSIVYLPNGEEVEIDPTQSREQGMALLNAKLYGQQPTYAVGQ